MLADQEIRTMIEGKHIGFAPYDDAYLNPASIDMTLSPLIRLPRHYGLSSISYPSLDVADIPEGHTDPFDMSATGIYRLDPGNFMLACTNETVIIPDDLVARVEGKSSIGRLGLAVHITAGFIDPGFEGQITLEIANLGPWAIWLHQDMRIAQIAFTRMSAPAEKPYGQTGHYQGQSGPVESRFKIQ